MVTAGVYLIVRSGPIFNAAPTAQTAWSIVGAVTLLFGAIIGCAKDDIKKALAASTMSQIGYMVLAAGLGPAGYAVAIMHLLTHGFFKAGLFLGAGSVMHAMNDETDMRRYGGLRKLLPITFVTFGLGYLAIIGVPPFAGFFSKDAHHRNRFDTGGAQGLAARRRGAAGRRDHRVLHDPGDAADVLRRETLGEQATETPTPHESPAVDDLADDRAGGRVGRRRRRPRHRGTLQDWLDPVVGSHEAEHAVPAWVMTVDRAGGRRDRRRGRLPHVRDAHRARDRAAAGVRLDRGRPPRPLR